MKTLKSQINQNLKKELFSLNQLVKFATKGDGKEYTKEYIKSKNVTLSEITIANLTPLMRESEKVLKTKNPKTGKFELTNEKKTKFSTHYVLTLIDRFEQSK